MSASIFQAVDVENREYWCSNEFLGKADIKNTTCDSIYRSINFDF